MVNIKNLNKAEVLKALWNHSHCQGMSFIPLNKKGGDFTLAEAQELVRNTPALYFGYVAGHIIKCDLSGDEFDERMYDRACGEGAAQRAIDTLCHEVEMRNHPYEGALLALSIVGAYNNNAIAEALHNAFKGMDDYISRNVILNKDPDITTGKEQTNLYICVRDLKNGNGVFDTLSNALKSVREFY